MSPFTCVPLFSTLALFPYFSIPFSLSVFDSPKISWISPFCRKIISIWHAESTFYSHVVFRTPSLEVANVVLNILWSRRETKPIPSSIHEMLPSHHWNLSCSLCFGWAQFSQCTLNELWESLLVRTTENAEIKFGVSLIDIPIFLLPLRHIHIPSIIPCCCLLKSHQFINNF